MPPPPIIVVDTGILYDCAASRALSNALLAGASGRSIWVPDAAQSEIKFRIKAPADGLPVELPTGALGLIRSRSAGIQVINDLSPAERARVAELQRRLGGSASANAAECEAVVIAARCQAPGALLLLDDANAVPVLARWHLDETGRELLYMHNYHLIDELTAQGHLTAAAAKQVRSELRRKKRPFM